MTDTSSTQTQAEVRRAYTTQDDPLRATADLASQLRVGRGDWIVLFCSPDYPLSELGPAIGRHLGQATVMACTTAGHQGPGGYVHEGIVGASVSSTELHAELLLIPQLGEVTIERATETAQDLRKAMEGTGGALTPDGAFAMLLVDGLAAREEVLAMGLDTGLEGIRLFGGSAADEGRLRSTHVYYDGAFHQDAAVLALVRTSHPFRIFKHAHFTPTNTKMVVTAARPDQRIVDRINGAPAAEEYARLLGLDLRDHDPMQLAQYPVMVQYGADHYMRTPMAVEPDGSVRFACAIEEGVVLTTAEPLDMVRSLEASFAEIGQSLGTPDLVIGCDCTGRLKEMEMRELTPGVARVLDANNAICFATYGEQLDSMHINQTLTGVALRVR